MKKLSIFLMLLLALAMGSHRVSAQSVTVTLMPGWNWISNPTMDTLDFAAVLGSFTPAVGDIIRSQWGSATYVGGQWRGNISQFYPGYGYKYKSSRTMPAFLTFNAQQPAPQVIVTTMEPTDITTNSATCGGNVASSDGNFVFVILRGICWSTNPNPTFNDNYVEVGNGIGSFTALMTDLAIGTTYYVRAFAVTANGTYYGDEMIFTTLDFPVGAVNSLFSVSANTQVYFSQGNLQYQASTNTWRFALNQWDYVGGYWYDTYDIYYGEGNVYENGIKCNNNMISSIYSGWIDLFGWGTSGYSHGAVCYQPWSISTGWFDYYAYGQYNYNLNDQTGEANWGYNFILNGGNLSNQWRTLSNYEWGYVFNSRTTASGIRYAKANVNSVNGIILLPDNWDISFYTLNNTNSSNASFNDNIITTAQWSILEQHGAVFLPAAKRRIGTSVDNYGHSFDYYSYGCYWTASFYNDNYAYDVVFSDSNMEQSYDYRSFGESVRLVHDAE